MTAIINIKVTNTIKKELDKLKLHPREPYHETIGKLIEIYKLFKEIKKDSMKQIEKEFDPADYVNIIKEIYQKL